MASKITHFFATRADLEPGLRAIESTRSLRYVRTGLFPTRALSEYLSALTIPNLASAPSGCAEQKAIYLVGDAQTPIVAEEVPQDAGGVRYAVDQAMNPCSIAFAPGCVLEDACLIWGYVGTISTDPVSLDLWRSFGRILMKGFTKVRGCYIGPEAHARAAQGWRLVANATQPRECDLHVA